MLGTDWFCYAQGFFLGLIVAVPVDRRSIFVTAKYNPPRTWTARGTVGFGEFTLSWYSVPGPGGYQCIGRTSPLLDLEQKHPSFKEDIALFHTMDRVRWYEVDEAELLRIEKLVDEGSSDFIYRKTPGRFSVGEWIEFEKDHKEEIDKWLAQVYEFSSKAPRP
jgi:allophanate hydrolase subunit 1